MYMTDYSTVYTDRRGFEEDRRTSNAKNAKISHDYEYQVECSSDTSASIFGCEIIPFYRSCDDQINRVVQTFTVTVKTTFMYRY